MKESNYEVYLKTDLSKYTGKWIAICEGKIIFVGNNAKEVFLGAQKKAPARKIMLIKVPEEETAIF